jgi:hypothetical protein
MVLRMVVAGEGDHCHLRKSVSGVVGEEEEECFLQRMCCCVDAAK